MSEMPVCLTCTPESLPSWVRTWQAGGERHAAASHAITIICQTENISRDAALDRLKGVR